MGALVSFLVGSKAGRLLLVLVAALSLCAVMLGKAYQSGRNNVQRKALEVGARIEQERKKDDADLQNLSDYELCTRYLDARRVQNSEWKARDPCRDLRGLQRE